MSKVLIANIISDPHESMLEYECPKCGSVFYLEHDAGKVKCSDMDGECDSIVMCDLISCMDTISSEFFEIN